MSAEKNSKKKKNTPEEDPTKVRNQEYIEEAASERSGVHKDTVRTVFNAVWEAICEELEDGNEVKLHGKGSFYLSKRSPRLGRNPLTLETYDVPEREAMAFRTSPAYAKRLRERRKQKAEQEKKNNE
ncbi:nucleoid DNA-binding protein [Rossellomorea marisflavi]